MAIKDCPPRADNVIIQLVNAQTKEPFQEHINPDTGISFVKVEPGLEYFISARNDSKNAVVLEYEVDGTDLGYECHVKSGTTKLQGLWVKKEGISTHAAFKISNLIADPAIPQVKSSRIQLQGGSSMDPLWIGSVTVTICHCENVTRKKKRADFETTRFKTRFNQDFKWRKGSLIKKVHIQYCSLVGLNNEKRFWSKAEKLPEKWNKQLWRHHKLLEEPQFMF